MYIIVNLIVSLLVWLVVRTRITFVVGTAYNRIKLVYVLDTDCKVYMNIHNLCQNKSQVNLSLPVKTMTQQGCHKQKRYESDSSLPLPKKNIIVKKLNRKDVLLFEIKKESE